MINFLLNIFRIRKTKAKLTICLECKHAILDTKDFPNSLWHAQKWAGCAQHPIAPLSDEYYYVTGQMEKIADKHRLCVSTNHNGHCRLFEEKETTK